MFEYQQHIIPNCSIPKLSLYLCVPNSKIQRNLGTRKLNLSLSCRPQKENGAATPPVYAFGGLLDAASPLFPAFSGLNGAPSSPVYASGGILIIIHFTTYSFFE